MAIGERIQKFRKYKELSARQFAEQLDTYKEKVYSYETGRYEISGAFLQKIVEVFPELNARWLLTGEGEMLQGGISSRDSDSVKTKIDQKLEDIERRLRDLEGKE